MQYAKNTIYTILILSSKQSNVVKHNFVVFFIGLYRTETHYFKNS